MKSALARPRTSREPLGKADFDLEVSRSYLISTVREMVQWTARSAYSTCFSEGEDFTCGIFDARGRLVVQAAGLPAHAGSLLDAMRAVMAAYQDFNPGDIIIHNDPFNGGSHQADCLVARPLFYEGELIGFAANKGHWIDIGGAAAGGWDGSATHVVQEGLIIPPIKLYEMGVLRREVRELLLRNVRMATQVWGDLQAQIASSVVAEKRMNELGSRKGVGGIRKTMEAVIEYSRRHFLTNLALAAKGGASAEDFMDGDPRGKSRLPIRVAIDVRDDWVAVDFAGTAPQATGPINASVTCTRAAAYAAVIAAIDPEVPISSGCLDLIQVKVPQGTLLNPNPPAPVFAGTADPGNRAAETVIRAFAQLDPSRLAAGSYATGNNTTGYARKADGTESLWYIFESGGCGARQDTDGNSAEWHLMANCKNESMEIWEARYPVRFEGYRLVPDSGGPGRKRGGLGTERRLLMLEDTSLSAIADRHEVPPWGLEGGSLGAPNAFEVVREGTVYRPSELGGLSNSKFGGLALRAGDTYVVRQGGGGGYGPAALRTYDEIDRDLKLGYVTPAAATANYSVVVREIDGQATVDRQASNLKGENRAR